ncbi:unnamed protein product [Diamesa tonsa]
MEKSPVREKSRDRRRRSKSRDRRRKRTPSKSPRKSRSISNSPPYRNRNRSLERGGFGGRGRFRDRNFFDRRRDSRSRSRGRGGFEDRGRRFDNRRNNNRRSNSPQRGNNDGYMQQQQQQQQQQVPVAPVMYGNDGSYGNFMPNAPAPPQFHHMPMQQQFNFDYQQQQPTYTASNFIQPDTNIYPPGDFVDPQLAAWPMMNVPPPMQPEESEEDKNKREAQIAQEKKTQREAIKEQRNQYISRSQIYKRELKVLKEQRTALIEGTPSNPPSPKTNKFVKENDKLQTQIQKKLVTILNVIDMLEELMGKDSSDDKESSSSKKKSSKKSRQQSPNSNDADKIKSEVLESMKKKQKVKEDSEDDRKKVNYIYYDPELHWCKACNVFPKSAKDYLLHLQSKDHAANTVKSTIETPWRDSFLVAAEIPATIPDVPTKRAPIRGIQFFMPVPSWYCKLCSVWMGDLHCASIHLKSPGHSDKYEELIATEPRWELDWLAKRQKALESCLPLGSIKEEQSASNGGMKLDDSEKKKDEKKSKKKKTKKDEKKDKKKRKRGKKRKKGSSSSSSSDSDDSDSTPTISESSMKEKKRDELMIQQWTSPTPVISMDEKKLLDNLKGKLKQREPEKKEKVVEKSYKKSEVESRGRDRSRSRDRSRNNNYRRRSRSRSGSNQRRRSRSRYRNRRRSSSRSRSRSWSRGRRVERPFVNFPPEPRLPPSRDDKSRLPARSYTATKKEVKSNDSKSSSASKKDSPLSSKVAKFNQQVSEHKSNQLDNPFSGEHIGRSRSPKNFLKPEDYGKPKPGSLTEYRGMKANIEVFQEMIDLCSIIHDEGRVVKGEPELREITFGELFQIYIHINDKVLGLLLRARKHELLTFEGECLFQKFHDHVSIFLLRPITKIREIMKEKQNDIRRSLSPNPRPTNELP